MVPSPGLEPGHPPYESGALPDELERHKGTNRSVPTSHQDALRPTIGQHRSIHGTTMSNSPALGADSLQTVAT